MIVPVRLKTLIIDRIIIYWWDFINGTLFQLPRDHVVQSKEMITLDNSTLNRPPDYQISFFIIETSHFRVKENSNDLKTFQSDTPNLAVFH